MKFEEIFASLLAEQHDGPLGDFDPDFAEQPDDVNNPPLPAEPDDINEPTEPQRPEDRRPEPPRRISRTQIIREKWKSDRPGLSDQEIDDAISFFNERKDRLKPYRPYGTIVDGRFWVNLPEITALVERFPDMETMLSNEAQMKDMGNYTWEQIQFYMNRIFHQAVQFDDENFVKGDYSEDQRIEWALERWKVDHNRIINDGTLTVYRIECQSEAVALGALDHSLYRKYNIDAMSNTKSEQARSTYYTNEIHKYINNQSTKGNDFRWGSQPWCVARPIDGYYGKNLWTNYRPHRAFYFLLDNGKPEYDQYHLIALQATGNGRYTITAMPNNGDYDYSWSEIERLYPGLRGKERLFPHFGTTSKEKGEETLDDIVFERGHPRDFAVQPESTHTAYINSGRHIGNKRCFLTLSFENRKLYIDKATKENNDYKRRFICTEPADDPLGILDILKNEKTKDGNLYKYLDEWQLKTILHIPEGVLAIKKSIIGTNFRVLYTDRETTYTLYATKEPKSRYHRQPKYGVMDVNSFNWIKDVDYLLTKPMSFAERVVDESGKPQIQIYSFHRYARSIGGQDAQPSLNDYFYFMFIAKDVMNPASPNYLSGKYFEGQVGDDYIREKTASGTFKRM